MDSQEDDKQSGFAPLQYPYGKLAVRLRLGSCFVPQRMTGHLQPISCECSNSKCNKCNKCKVLSSVCQTDHLADTIAALAQGQAGFGKHYRAMPVCLPNGRVYRSK